MLQLLSMMLQEIYSRIVVPCIMVLGQTSLVEVYFTTCHSMKETFQMEAKRAVRSFTEIPCPWNFWVRREFGRHHRVKFNMFSGSLPWISNQILLRFLREFAIKNERAAPWYGRWCSRNSRFSFQTALKTSLVARSISYWRFISLLVFSKVM